MREWQFEQVISLDQPYTVLDLGIDQGGGIPHQAEKGEGIGNKVGASFNRFLIKCLCDYSTYTL